MRQEFIIFDTEYASWQGYINLSEEERKKTYVDIVQIAALKVSLENLEVISELNLYVKPQEKLTDYFINLTGITDEKLAKDGIPFYMAYPKFKSFCGDLPCYSHGWSSNIDHQADGQIMQLNLESNRIIDNNPLDYRNIANWFRQEYQKRKINIASQSSGKIAKLLGCEKDLQHLNLDEHNALYDVYSILAGLKYLGFNQLF